MLDKLIISIYNSLILLMPYALSYKGISYSKILFVFSTIISIYFITKKRITKKLFKDKTFKWLTIGFLIFAFAVIISNCISFIDMKKIVLSDVFEILRILQYYLIVLNYYVLFKEEENKKFFKISIIVLFVINMILAFFQFHNLFGLNELYIKILAPTQYEALVNNYRWPRAVGLAANPNVFGFLMALISNYVLYLIFKNKKSIYLYLVYFLSVIGIFLSSSRSSYIALIIGGCLLVLFNSFKFNKEGIKKFFVIGFVFVSFHFILLMVLPKIYTWRVQSLISIGNINSWQQRLEKTDKFIESIKSATGEESDEKQIDEEIKKEKIKQNNSVNQDKKIKQNNSVNQSDKKIKQNNSVNQSDKKIKKDNFFKYVIGNGPRTTEVHMHYDNEWIQLFDYYGILGVAAYIAMLLLPVITIKSNSKFNYKLYLSIIVMSFVYMIPAATYHCYLLFALTSILFAYCLNDKKTCY